MVILLFSTLLRLPIYIFATPLLNLLGLEHELAVLAGKFALLSIPELFSLAVTVPASKFLQSQSKVGALACIGFVVLLLHAFFLWLFIYVFNLDINGGALVYNITGWANAIAQFVYVIVWCKDGWTGWSLSALNEIWAFVRLSIASAVILCLETWYMMSIIVLTGHLKDAVIVVGSLLICKDLQRAVADLAWLLGITMVLNSVQPQNGENCNVRVMETPFLHDFSGDHLQLIGPDDDYLPVKGLKEWWVVFWIETVKLWEIGGPISFNVLCQYGTYSITVAFCGHLSVVELFVISVAQNVIGTLSFGFMLGMRCALETLCGQAFRAWQIHMLGIYTQRSMVILLFSKFLLLPIYIFATPLLKFLGQEHEMVVLAGKFAMLSIPELYSLAVTIPTSKILQAQSKVGVVAWIGFVDLLLHALLLWLFIHVFNLSTDGAALTFNITGWVDAIAQFVYVVVWCKDGWTGWSLSALNEI
ncbi:hypothetical protein RDI58_007964 [Solanum bulbocastanum]|uniref:Protein DETOXIFICATION n=1 Tax=Solanum bulbocastanum TaxID=147425 RepID=A0AAN8U1K3_SOLBU